MINQQQLDRLAEELSKAAEAVRNLKPEDATVRGLEYIQNYTYGATQMLHDLIDNLMEER